MINDRDVRLKEYSVNDILDFFSYWLDRVALDQAIDMCKEIYFIQHAEILAILKDSLLERLKNGK